MSDVYYTFVHSTMLPALVSNPLGFMRVQRVGKELHQGSSKVPRSPAPLVALIRTCLQYRQLYLGRSSTRTVVLSRDSQSM